MMEYEIKITKGAFGMSPCSYVMFLYEGKIYIERVSGRAIQPEELVTILTSAPELSKIRVIAEQEAMPIVTWEENGTSGCKDIYIRNVVKNQYFSTHISMYGKMNEGAVIPLWGLTALINELFYTYGSSSVVEFEVKESNNVKLYSYFPTLPVIPDIYINEDEI